MINKRHVVLLRADTPVFWRFDFLSTFFSPSIVRNIAEREGFVRCFLQTSENIWVRISIYTQIGYKNEIRREIMRPKLMVSGDTFLK